MTAVHKVDGGVQQCNTAAAAPPPAANTTEDKWDHSHHQAFVGGMSQAHYFAAQQHQQQQQRSQGFVPLLGQYVMHMAAQRLAGHAVGIAEWAIFAAGRQAADTYRWCFPLSPEELVRRALFTRVQIEAFMAQAIKDNATFVLVQPHRLSSEVREGLLRDGYRVEDGEHQGAPATRIYFVRKDPDRAHPSARKPGWFWQRS